MPCDSNLARRLFLLQFASAGTLGVLDAADKTPAAWFNDQELRAYRDQIGSAFEIRTDAGETVAVELQEVASSEFPPGPVGRRQPFSLIFRVPGNRRLRQEVYDVWHPRLGTVRHLLVPVDSPRTCNHLEAVLG